MADDLARSIEKAHKGSLPGGVLAGQFVSVSSLSTNALRAPLTDDVLARMDQCRTVRVHEASCRVVRTKASWKQIDAELAVSVRFDDEITNGETVHAELKDALLSASVTLQDHQWRLTALTPIASSYDASLIRCSD